MIALLTGTVKSLHADRVVIDVGGVGYVVTITPATLHHLAMGSVASLHTSMVVREDSMTLYGFADESAKNLFDVVQTVSGIGPKVALSIVSALSYEDLARAIAQEDISLISKVPGIGKKGAQRLVLELKGKLIGESSIPISTSGSWRESVMSALVSLGFSQREADAAINDFARAHPEQVSTKDVGEILKSVLAQGRRR